MYNLIQQVIFVPKFGNDNMSPEDSKRMSTITQMINNIVTTRSLPFVMWHDRCINKTNLNTLFIVVGGDGSVLTALRETLNYPAAYVYGINFGKLGFLTAYNGVGGFELLQQEVESIFDRPQLWMVDERASIQSVVTGSNKQMSAVNEFLITTPTRRNPLQYTIQVNGQHVATQSGDGVIVATATGSTAYAMSAGGAIMNSSSKSLQIVPLAPHTLTSRPIIVDSTDRVTIMADLSQRAGVVEVVADGATVYDTNWESNNSNVFQLNIRQDSPVKILRPNGWNFFDTLATKFNWG